MATVNQLVRKPRATKRQKHGAGLSQPAEARCLHACLHDDAEEAELGDAQGRPCALTNGFEVTQSYIGGEGHNLQEHSVVLIRGGVSRTCRVCATTRCAARSTVPACPIVARAARNTARSVRNLKREARGPKESRIPRKMSKITGTEAHDPARSASTAVSCWPSS